MSPLGLIAVVVSRTAVPVPETVCGPSQDGVACAAGTKTSARRKGTNACARTMTGVLSTEIAYIDSRTLFLKRIATALDTTRADMAGGFPYPRVSYPRIRERVRTDRIATNATL